MSSEESEGSESQQGYVPSNKGDKEMESPFLMMENLLDKLKLLDYENLFCKTKTTPALQTGLNHTFFAMPHKNPNEQFFYFTSLTSFLMNLCGRSFHSPSQFDDPTATSVGIVEELKEMGFVTDFSPNKLREGHGETVCTVLNLLCDQALERKGFKFGQPKHIPQKGAEVLPEEDEEEEEEIMVADETGVDDEEQEEVLRDVMETPRDSESEILEAKVDPAEWKIEVERVSPFLQLPKNLDQKDWRSHFTAMKAHHKTIQQNFNETKEQLEKMQKEIVATLEEIETREKHINSQFAHLIEEYKAYQEKYVETNDKFLEANEKVNELTNELQHLVDSLDSVKQQMEAQGSSMTDTGPLVKLKNMMKKIAEEIIQFEVRIGVVEHTLMQAKIQSKKKNGPAFGSIL